MFFTPKKALWLLAALCSYTPHVWADEQNNILTLTKVESMVLQSNPALAAAKQKYQALLQRPAQVKSLPDPTLKLNALNLPVDSFSTTQENMTQLQIGIAQQIPFPGKLSLKEKEAQLWAQASGDDANEIQLQSVSQAKTSWWNLFYLDRAIDTVSRNQQLLRQLIRIAETKYKVGEGLQQDVLLAQLELSKLLDIALQLQASRRQEEAKLNRLLYQANHTAIQLPSVMPETLPRIPDAQALAKQAMQSRPLLAKHTTMIDAAQTRVALAEKDYYPDFKLGAAYGIRSGINPATRRSRPDFASIQFSMNLPFINHDKYKHQVNQRQAELARAKFSFQDVQESIAEHITQLVANYEKAKSQAELFKHGIIPQAQQTVSSMRAGYQVDKVDFLNFIRSQIILYNYETQYWKAIAEANQNLEQLDASVGQKIHKEFSDE